MSYTPGYIDAHAHLQDPRCAPLLERWLESAQALGIERWILGGVGPEDWERQRALTETSPSAFSMSYGLHPWWVAERTSAECEEGFTLLEAALEGGGAVGLGELGLDFNTRFPADSRPRQEEFFRRQLELSAEHRLPLILHIVGAHHEALKILEAGPGDYTGIVHSFGADEVIAKRYLKLGLTPSISAGVLSRNKGKAFEDLRRAVIKFSPREFVIETDSPDQPPAAMKGQLHPPMGLLEVAKWVAEIRRTTGKRVLEDSRDNLVRIFGEATPGYDQ
jgi:TatD DNase family protein